MSRVLKFILMTLNIFLLAACGTATPIADSTLTLTRARAPASPTQTGTPAPTVTTVPPTPASSPTATSTLTSVLPTLSVTVQRDLVEETREAEAFCYQDPRKALDDYLTFLYQGEYEKAARLYGGIGDYPNHKVIPPDALAEEKIEIEATSLANFCEGYGTCLRQEIVKAESISSSEIVFIVYFYEDDGKLFIFEKPITDDAGNAHFEIVGPEFHYRVQKIEGCFKSMDVPPITP